MHSLCGNLKSKTDHDGQTNEVKIELFFLSDIYRQRMFNDNHSNFFRIILFICFRCIKR